MKLLLNNFDPNIETYPTVNYDLPAIGGKDKVTEIFVESVVANGLFHCVVCLPKEGVVEYKDLRTITLLLGRTIIYCLDVSFWIHGRGSSLYILVWFHSFTS